MLSPGAKGIIQIDITNHCIRNCSNCTRFCGLHEKRFMMSLPEFTNAVDSLADYPGIVGVMGGEPTLNPDFPEMVKYLRKKRPAGRKSPGLLAPVKDFNRFHGENWNTQNFARRALWSTLGTKYYENLELIAETFPYQCLNDHRNSGMHQALLLPRQELGIPDEEWYPLRDKCWIQNQWSAAITPKGAFFCEVAAALDWLLDGPGGWPVEPGWWKRTPEEFGEQLKWCEYCSAPLAVPQIHGNAETDIISPGIWEKIKDRKAWKITTGHYRIFDTANYDSSKYKLNYYGEPYLSKDDKRIAGDERHALFPHHITVVSEHPVPETAPFEKGTMENAEKLEFKDWLLIVNAPLPEKTWDYIANAIFNPGAIYYSPGRELIFLNRKAAALTEVTTLPEISGLLALYPAGKRYKWHNFRTPERPHWSEKAAKIRKALYNRSSILLYRILRKLHIIKRDLTIAG